MFEISEQNETIHGKARIRVIGVGGGGCNAVNTMIRSGLNGVEYIVANTDAQALNASLANIKIQLGPEITKGLGAGANPEVGRKSALEEYERLSEVLTGADMIFITAGMGGGTGTGAAPVIAKLAKELGALTVGVVTKPFLFEGKRRFRVAEQGIVSLEECVDSLITIPNQRLLYLAGENLSLVETFKKADEVLLNAVQGISDLINNTGLINADFADVKTVMANKGMALMGTGISSGPDRAIKAATEAISSPLLEDVTIDGATGIIINITGSSSLTTHETNEAVTLIMEAADEDAEIIFGTVIDDSAEEYIKVTVIATGLGLGKVNNKMQAVPSITKELMERAPSSKESLEIRSQPAARSVPQAQAPRASAPAPIHEEQVLADNSNREERPATGLAQSIREAADKFDHEIKNPRQERPASASADFPRGNRESSKDTTSRSKSIAERLGFINFEDDEFDTPTFLRKENDKIEVTEKRITPRTRGPEVSN